MAYGSAIERNVRMAARLYEERFSNRDLLWESHVHKLASTVTRHWQFQREQDGCW